MPFQHPIDPLEAAAQATKAPADNLLEIEGSVGDQNLIVEEQDMVPPSIAPLPHTPSVTQPGASGGDEMKVQEATRVEENAKVEVPVPNTQVYEPPPQPSLDSDAINAARVEEGAVEVGDQGDEEDLMDYEDLDEVDGIEAVELNPSAEGPSLDGLGRNQVMIEEMRAKHVEEEQAKVQEKIKAAMAEIELRTATELKEKDETSEGETNELGDVEEPEPFSVELMTTPAPPIVDETDNIGANVDEVFQAENVRENEAEGVAADSQTAVDPLQAEHLANPELNIQEGQEVHGHQHTVRVHHHEDTHQRGQDRGAQQ